MTESGQDTRVFERDATADDYTIVLLAQPGAEVQIALNYDTTQVMVDPNVLLFTAGNWNQPQTVSVTAVDDVILEDYLHPSTISHTVTSSDSTFNGISLNSVVVLIYDNECGRWSYPPADFNRDCRVDLLDLLLFSSDWLDCTQPDASGCSAVE